MNLSEFTDRKKHSLSDNAFDNLNEIYKKTILNMFNEDNDIFKEYILGMCEYHIKNSKDNYLFAFNHLEWQYFPIEILFLLKERVKRGLSIEGITHPLIEDFLPYFLNEFQISEQNKHILNLILE